MRTIQIIILLGFCLVFDCFTDTIADESSDTQQSSSYQSSGGLKNAFNDAFNDAARDVANDTAKSLTDSANDLGKTIIGGIGRVLKNAITGVLGEENNAQQRAPEQRMGTAYITPPAPSSEQNSGYWADVPGQWFNGKWIPPRSVWVPAKR